MKEKAASNAQHDLGNGETLTIKTDKKSHLFIGFGKTPAQNDVLVKEAEHQLDELINKGEICGGEIIRINGPTTLPVALVLAHKLSHRYQAVAMYDPKLSRYVIAIAHGDKYSVGELID
ncbi:CRISPR-associated protein Csx3 [Prosthecochloris sp. N3]|uniref:CRISPR-associated protein Csx3 n=2 Tax=Prosthecochloris ethylica TaxID=2743976 RepID=A0ABR9XTK2_9CHLB|nr:CRISPR-associated protein Csx3 [Prosthecochloris ethylica]MBF0637192.1 CRISPR-associated protein Csx3 [Prosthecochloris ethylica]NUK48200.1 CRISPR-associated protein Csx3 [Prosthecochloris ethylica]